MFNFDIPRYEKVVGDAIALRTQIENAVDKICAEGFSNIYFIGCGGTYAHSLPMCYWIEHTSNKLNCIRAFQKTLYAYFPQGVEIRKK